MLTLNWRLCNTSSHICASVAPGEECRNQVGEFLAQRSRIALSDYSAGISELSQSSCQVALPGPDNKKYKVITNSVSHSLHLSASYSTIKQS